MSRRLLAKEQSLAAGDLYVSRSTLFSKFQSSVKENSVIEVPAMIHFGFAMGCILRGDVADETVHG